MSRSTDNAKSATTALCPPLGGGDLEFCNFILGRGDERDTATEAARMLLAEFDGIPAESRAEPAWKDNRDYPGVYRDNALFRTYGAWDRPASDRKNAINPQDWCRKFTLAGASVYIDMSHAEIAIPEIRSAYDFVKYHHAMLRLAAGAQASANEKLRLHGRQLQVMASNSDGRSASWGAHTNFLIPRSTFDDIASHKIHYLSFLASYQVSSIVFTGQGKAGSENNEPAVEYQITQRGDFMQCVCGTQTTFNRPLVNLRDEALCGRESSPWARLHVIFYDAALCHVANYLKFGVMQIVLGMIASGRVNLKLILDDPVDALRAWGHDVTLTRRCRTMLGEELTAVELQMRFLQEARQFVECGECDLADAPSIMSLWEDTLMKLKSGDFHALAGRLDWVLKLLAIRGAMERKPRLTWDSPEVKCLDMCYSSLNPDDGLFWAFERAGSTQRIVPEEEILRATTEPPQDSRAWTRAMLLRRFGDQVESMDWDRIRFRLERGGFAAPAFRTLEMPDPLGMTREKMERVLTDGKSLIEVLDELGARADVPPSAVAQSSCYEQGEWYGSATNY
ncbi:MAG: proteasome accessory factor PafA2 family protein [Tepidisphaeraceae bacterium]|jgi:proteasome accessory factor A